MKKRKYIDQFEKSSPEPLGQFQPKLGTNLLWVKGIQVCSNVGLCLFPKGYEPLGQFQ